MTRLSAAGTISDALLGSLACFIAPIFEFASYISRIDHWLENRFEIAVMLFFCTCLYPLYVSSLFVDLVRAGGTFLSVEVDPSSLALRAFVKFEQAPHVYGIVNGSKSSKESKLVMKIKLLRIAKLQKCVNPIVKFRVGPIEVKSGPSLYGGSDPEWPNEWITLPLDKIRDNIFEGVEGYLCLDVEVVDQNPITGDEAPVAQYESDGTPQLKAWIGNRRFEGQIKLRGGQNTTEASMTVAIKIEVDFDANLNWVSKMADLTFPAVFFPPNGKGIRSL